MCADRMAPGPRPPYWSEKGRSFLGVELASTKLTLAKGRKGSIWQHPELIITGLSKTVAHQMLDIIAVHIEEKRPIDLSTTTDALLTGYTGIPAALSRRRSRITTSTSDSLVVLSRKQSRSIRSSGFQRWPLSLASLRHRELSALATRPRRAPR